MKSYILGYYAPDKYLLETLANPNRRMALDSLVNSHPASMKIRDIALEGKIQEKTLRGADYLNRMLKEGFIREVDKGKETGGAGRYVFENVNSLSRGMHTNYYLAPGNVEYTDEFKIELNRLTNQTEIKTKFRNFLEFVRYIVESVKRSDNEQIAPGEGASYVCSTCGLNHEARDFIRATLMFLIDQFEKCSDYLEFLNEQHYIDKKHYNDYYELVQENMGKRKSEGPTTEQTVVERPAQKELNKETLSEDSKWNEKKIVAKIWFDNKKSGLTKDMIEFILLEKPEISIEKLKSLVDHHQDQKEQPE